MPFGSPPRVFPPAEMPGAPRPQRVRRNNNVLNGADDVPIPFALPAPAPAQRTQRTQRWNLAVEMHKPS